MRTIGRMRQLALGAAALGAMTLGGSFVAVPASAGVSVGIGIGVPGPAYYGTYRIRTGPCSHPRYAYRHPWRCGYPRFSEPVFINGVWVNEPLYWRTYNGSRYFWYRGRWVTGHGGWDGHVYRGDWTRTWHDRGWDRADVRERMEDRRENMRDRMQDRMQDRREDMRDRMQDRREDMRDRDHDRDDRGMNDRDRDDRGGRDNDRDRDNDNDRGH